MDEGVIIDASAMVDLLVGSPLAEAVKDRVQGHALHAPGHFDAEVLSAIVRLHRAGHLSQRRARTRIGRLAVAPINRHDLSSLGGAWQLRHNLRVVDALYVELGNQLDMTIVTTDSGMADAAPAAELIAQT